MADFKLFIPLLQQVEGGYQNLIGDPGNYNSLGQRVGTNFGISARFYEDVINRPPTVSDMMAITKDKASQIYKLYFWDKVHGDSLINQSVANLIADHAVNAGESSIAKIVQRILKNDFKKNISIDGDIGPATASAINSVDQQILFNKIVDGRKAHYLALGGEFLQGWLNRLKIFVFSLSEKKKK